MRVTLTEKRGAVMRVVLLAVIVALVPLPAAAGGGASTAKHPTASHQSLRAAVTREASRVPLARSTTRRDDQDQNGLSSFFKSRPGAIAIVVMAIGTGYAIYSTQHDRVKSPGKQ